MSKVNDIVRAVRAKFSLTASTVRKSAVIVELQQERANLIVSLDAARREIRQQLDKNGELHRALDQTKAEALDAEQLLTAIKTCAQEYEYPLTRVSVLKLFAQRGT